MLNYLAITPSLRQRKNNHYLKSKYRILRSFLDLGVVSSGHLLHNPNIMDPYYGNLQQILKKKTSLWLGTLTLASDQSMTNLGIGHLPFEHSGFRIRV